MRDSRCPRGTFLAPGRWPAANSSLPRTSTIATPSSISSLTSDGIDLLDLALDLAEKLRARRAHLKTPKPRSGFIDFTKYSAARSAFARCPSPIAGESPGGRTRCAAAACVPSRGYALQSAAHRRAGRARRCCARRARVRADRSQGSSKPPGATATAPWPRCQPARVREQAASTAPRCRARCPRPAFTLTTSTGARVSLSQLRGAAGGARLPVPGLRRHVRADRPADPRRARRTRRTPVPSS